MILHPMVRAITIRGAAACAGMLLGAAAAILPFTETACSRTPPATEGKATSDTATAGDGETRFRVETVATGLEVPWALAFLPDGRILVTERPGRVRVIENGTLRPAPVATIADVESTSESGLMDIELHPRFASNHLLYLSYAYRSSNGMRDRIARYRLTDTGLADRTVIIEDIPAAQFHAGCRMSFGSDGKLYITTGDATEPNQAQDLGRLGGKTLRLNDGGSVPSDNPFVGQRGARPEVWSYGHRNPQGIAWQPGTGLLFETEHGPSGGDAPGGGDEVNIVEAGKNYGWPVVHHRASQAGMVSPLLEYTPAVAPASAMFYRGTALAGFQNNFFFGCLRGARIIRVVLDGRRVVSQEPLLDGKYGRIREMAEGPDGAIYFTTSNRDGRGVPTETDDRVLRIVPVK